MQNGGKEGPGLTNPWKVQGLKFKEFKADSSPEYQTPYDDTIILWPCSDSISS